MSNPLIGTPIRELKKLSDVLIWMTDNEREYCCTAIEIQNGGGSEITVDIGTIVADAALADSATHAELQPPFDDALVIDRVKIPAGESRDVAALVRGPALVNFDELVRTSDAESDASLRGRCDKLILQGIRFKRHPSNVQRTDLNG